MIWKSSEDVKSDPSDIKQHFCNLEIKLHCCRYWKLSEWEFNNMSFPFWRIYYNTIEGAKIGFNQKVVYLNEKVVILIPPYTSFSTSLKNFESESLNGSRIQSVKEYNNLIIPGMVDHLFIHFNLGFEHDHVEPDIYVHEINPGLKELIGEIRNFTIQTDGNFGFNETMLLHRIIFSLVSTIPKERMINNKLDKRILKVMGYIDKNYMHELKNENLAKTASMATNSFLRLFRATTGITLQKFVQKKRIEKAITYMHNQSSSIDQIAEKCGFSDRHHFTKVFKKQVSVSPGIYRKTHTIM